METTEQRDPTTHSREQAQAQFESIAAMVAALECDYDRLEDLRDQFAAWKEEEEESAVTEGRAPIAELTPADWAALSDEGEELVALTEAAGDCESREDAEQRIQEDPLSVEVRSAWHTLDDPDNKPSEFKILLCTGGPAVQIRGELDEHLEPCRAWLEHQDWGTPWQQYYVKDGQETLLAYCRQFYFGE